MWAGPARGLVAPRQGVEEVTFPAEDEYFPPPRSLRELVSALEVVATWSLGGRVADRPTVVDRRLEASEVLASVR